jgi:hypothetical protein
VSRTEPRADARIAACRRAAARIAVRAALAALASIASPTAATSFARAAADAPASPRVATVESEHYGLVSEGPEDEAKEFSRVLEAAWPQLAEFFGAAPKLAKGQRLTVRFFETQAAMNAAIVAGGGVAPDAGGYYCPVARTSYAFRQPTRWYTRTLLIHEATHQFHLLGVAAGAPQPPSWWQEGLAEHLSHHTWDGTTLRLGVVPPVSQEDRFGAARRSMMPLDYPVESIPDEKPLDRPRTMHLVRFLATGDGGKPLPVWKALAATLDRGGTTKPRDLWKSFGRPQTFRDRFHGWLHEAEQPFLSEFVEWDSLAADAVRGTAGSVAICRTREPAASIAASVVPADPSKPWRAGLLLAWRGPDDYVIGQIDSGTSVRVDRRLAGAWQTLHEGRLPEGAAAPWKLSAERRGSEIALRIGDADAAVVTVPEGPLGLCLDNCTAVFRGIVRR